jgi:MoaA/NifB/PqqE/SkfB family radical SAM enzyme
MKLDSSRLSEYNETRTIANKSVVCYAPFTNINFAQNGNMTACCFNRSHVLGKYPAQSIQEAWTGTSAENLRNHIQNNDLGGGCKLCALAIESKNFSGTKAIYFDPYSEVNLVQKSRSLLDRLMGKKPPLENAPRVFEFEISNTCNLECVMCDGYFSSTIRKQREKLPPVKHPYDDAFVEQVASFLPGITDLKFLGGEPFLIDIYIKIWEKVLQINPKIKIHITTNGTVLNERIKDLLNKLNCGIVVSIDSLDETNYGLIRKGASLQKVLDNIEYFYSLTKSKGTYLSLAVCPMRQNWKDMPALVDFANERDITVHFNTVWNPQPVSLRFAPVEFLKEVEALYTGYLPPQKSKHQKINYENFKSLTNQITQWKTEQSLTGQLDKETFTPVLNWVKEEGQKGNRVMQIAALQLEQFLYAEEKFEETRLAFQRILSSVTADEFIQSYLDGAFFWAEKMQGESDTLNTRKSLLKETCKKLNDKLTFASDTINSGVMAMSGYLLYEDADLLQQTLLSRYA